MSEALSDESFKVVVTGRELLVEGRILSFVREQFDYNGTETAREIVEHPGAVAVLAIDSDNRVLLVKQYRHPIRMRAWELPAGLLDVAGEAPLVAAQRELAEETDTVASEWTALLDVTTSAGSSNEVVRIFLARGLSAAEDAYEREAEEADMELRWAPLDDVVAAVLAGSIRNSILIAGVLAVAAQAAAGMNGRTTP
jgi:8-oxo-dGTP pyrophosphatase MutT (NUDIX family)